MQTPRFRVIGTLVVDDEFDNHPEAKYTSYRCASREAAQLQAALFNAANDA